MAHLFEPPYNVQLRSNITFVPGYNVPIGIWDGRPKQLYELRITDSVTGVVIWSKSYKVDVKATFYIEGTVTAKLRNRSSSIQGFWSPSGKGGDFVAFTGAIGLEPITQPGASANTELLKKGNSKYVFSYKDANGDPCIMRGGKSVQPMPLESIRGLAVHTTASDNSNLYRESFWAENFTFGQFFTHFLIDRYGSIAQFAAVCYRCQGLGGGPIDSDANWVSVEIVSGPISRVSPYGDAAPPTEKQLESAGILLRWLNEAFAVPMQLATTYTGSQYSGANRAVGTTFSALTKLSESLGDGDSSDDVRDTNGSEGLSCHNWLSPVKVCPGYDIMESMPKIVQYAQSTTLVRS